jgi:hypothetical protein
MFTASSRNTTVTENDTNKGVEMLLRRMDSHPEEFVDMHDPYNEQRGKWTSIMNELAHRMEIIDRDNGVKADPNTIYPIRQVKPLGYLSDEEVTRIHTKLMQVQRELFDRRVMKALLTGPELKMSFGDEEGMQAGAASMTALSWGE